MKKISASVLRKDLRITIRVPITASANWSNSSKLVAATMHVENTLAREGKSSKENRSSAEISEGKEIVERFSKQTKFGFSKGSHWDSDRDPKCLKCGK